MFDGVKGNVEKLLPGVSAVALYFVRYCLAAGEHLAIAVMFIFAILFFGILMDAGTFKPLIRRLLKAAGKDPARITVATAILAMIVHLDGSGAVTFLITVPAMLPLYDALGMRRTTLATVTALLAVAFHASVNHRFQLMQEGLQTAA